MLWRRFPPAAHVKSDVRHRLSAIWRNPVHGTVAVLRPSRVTLHPTEQLLAGVVQSQRRILLQVPHDAELAPTASRRVLGKRHHHLTTGGKLDRWWGRNRPSAPCRRVNGGRSAVQRLRIMSTVLSDNPPTFATARSDQFIYARHQLNARAPIFQLLSKRMPPGRTVESEAQYGLYTMRWYTVYKFFIIAREIGAQIEPT